MPNLGMGYQMAAFSVQADFGDADGKERAANYISYLNWRHFPEYLAVGATPVKKETIETEVIQAVLF